MKHPLSCLFLMLLFNSAAWALVRVPAGELNIEGKIFSNQEETKLILNQGTNSEIQIKLLGFIPSEFFKQSGSNASIKVQLEKSFYSRWGEAKFIGINKFLAPFEDPKIYTQVQDF